LIAVVLVLLVGGYSPPFTPDLWRRLIGGLAGAALLGMSIAAHRGLLDDPDGRAVPTDPTLVLWGELAGAAVLIGWAANLVR
jgi:hypothetical protein